MYDYIIGKVTKITPAYIVVEAAGIGYLINVANPYSFSSQLNQEIKIFIQQIIREDAHSLYGFATDEEKVIFLKLTSVTGIGPKSALATLAADDNAGLINAIDNNDIKYLTKFPGVGKKTAMQMVLDLAGKFDGQNLASNQLKQSAATDNTALAEAIEALQTLGYKAVELKKIEKQLEAESPHTSEEYIKLALKAMIH